MLFVVKVEDNPGHIESRRDNLSAHIDWLDGNKDRVLVGGSLRHEPGKDLVGGLRIVEAASKEGVTRLIETDPFASARLRKNWVIMRCSEAFPDRLVQV